MEYECELCKDTEYIYYEKDGKDYAKECSCREKRKAKRLLSNSGISEELHKKGFNDFNTKGIEQLQRAKEKAQKYYQDFMSNEKIQNNSIIFCGQVGSGKTHLGMAICNNLLNICGVGIRYMAYRNAVTKIKQCITDEINYSRELNSYSTARVLFIDDLLKGKTTNSDVNILYEIINYRYLNNMPLVISTEFMPDTLLDFDEAVGSRILEMCRGNIIVLEGKDINHRLCS